MDKWSKKILTRYKWLCGLFGHKYVTHGIYHTNQQTLNDTHFVYRYVCTRCGKVKDL